MSQFLVPGAAAPSDPELISAVRSGNGYAYGVLFERHRRAALTLARQIAGPSDADDLVSDAFIKVLRVLSGGGGPDVAFRAYLLTAVRRLHIDRIRANAKVSSSDELDQFDPGVPFVDPAVSHFESTAAAKAFASLPERWQLVLWHLEVEGQKPAEVAPLLGLTANSVSALAYRAREGLRQAYLQMHLADTAAEECRWVTERLGAHVRNGLSRRDAAKVDQHLDECARCAGVYLELTEVNSNLSAIIAPLLLGSAAAAYLAGTSGSTAAVGVVSLLAKARHLAMANSAASTAGAAAASIAVVAVTVAVIATGGPAKENGLASADAPISQPIVTPDSSDGSPPGDEPEDAPPGGEPPDGGSPVANPPGPDVDLPRPFVPADSSSSVPPSSRPLPIERSPQAPSQDAPSSEDPTPPSTSLPPSQDNPSTAVPSTTAPSTAVPSTATPTTATPTTATPTTATPTTATPTSTPPPSTPSPSTPPPTTTPPTVIPPAPALPVIDDVVNNLIGTANGTNAGDTINYAISITNAGEATLTDLTAVIDSATDTAPAECPVVELEGGASTTCTASYVINQADVDTGEVTKQVTVSGQDESSGEIVSVSDTSTFQLSPAPVAILALATELQVIELNDIIGVNAGDQIRYAFDVTNTGALTLSQISIEEDADKLGEIACDESTLAPGASTTCTAVYEVTPADELDLGVVTQTTALAVTLQGDPVISLPSEDTVETTPVGVDIDMSGSSVDPLGLGQYRFNLAPQTKPPVTTPLDLTMTIAIEGFMGDLNVKFNGWSCTGFTGGTGTAVCTITSATPPEIELQVRQKTPLATLAATVEAADNVDPVQTNNLFTWMSVPLPPKP